MGGKEYPNKYELNGVFISAAYIIPVDHNAHQNPAIAACDTIIEKKPFLKYKSNQNILLKRAKIIKIIVVVCVLQQFNSKGLDTSSSLFEYKVWVI